MTNTAMAYLERAARDLDFVPDDAFSGHLARYDDFTGNALVLELDPGARDEVLVVVEVYGATPGGLARRKREEFEVAAVEDAVVTARRVEALLASLPGVG